MSWWEFAELFDRPREVPWRSAGFLPDAPIAEFGSGSGINLIPLLDALPHRRVIAVEPDAEARSLLMHRLVRAGALDRVTIEASTLETAQLPKLGGAVVTGLLYFLAPDARRCAWRMLGEALLPEAPVVIEVADANDPAEPEPERLVRTAQVGELTYERWFSQRPLGGGRVELVNVCRVRRGDRLVREVPCVFHTWVLSDADKRAEALATGAFELLSFPDSERYVRLVRK